MFAEFMNKKVFFSSKTGSGKLLCFECFYITLNTFPHTKNGCLIIVIELLISINEEGFKVSNIEKNLDC